MSKMEDEKQLAIHELKAHFDENNRKLMNLESQKRSSEVVLRRAAFTAAQLDEMPENVHMYRQVGKAYFLQPKPAIMGHMEQMVKSSDAELKRLASSKEALIKTQEGLKTEITELLASLRKR